MTVGLRALLAAVLLFQIALQGLFFPVSGLAGGGRLNNIDAPFHVYQMHLARELCEERRAVGYDPRFAAGHTGGVTFNASAKLPALIACVLPEAFSVEQIYKHVSFWSGVLGPALIVVACTLMGLPLHAAATAGLLAVLMWWTGGLRWYHTAGMVSYVLAAFAIPAFVTAVMRWSDRICWPAWGLLGLAAAAGLLLHPLFAVGASLLGAPWFLADTARRRLWKPRLLAAGAIVLVMLGANAFWIVPTVSVPGIASAPTPYQREVDPLLFARELLGEAPTAAGGSRLYATLLVGAALAMALVRGPARAAVFGLSAGAVVLMAWASLAALSPSLALLQPNRFSALAWLALVPPAAAGLVFAVTGWSHRPLVPRLVLASLLLVAVLPIAYFVRETWREAAGPADAPRYGVRSPEVRGAGPFEEEMVRFLREATSPDERAYFETSLGRVHDGGHIAGMLAWRSGRELIGGPYPFAGYANAWDGWAFGSDLRALSRDQLARQLDAYGVRWIACHSVTCKAAMSELPGAKQVRTIGQVVVFTRHAVEGLVAKGGSAVVSQRCGNRVEFERVTGQRLVLRYQWVPGLHVVPAGRVEPEVLIEGTPPFVAVIDPPVRFALKLGPEAGRPCAERSWRAPVEGGVP